jgi:hypothetical protein
MIAALLLMADLVLMLWLVWCLTRKWPRGKARNLGILAYHEDREVAKAEAAAAKLRRKGHHGPGAGGA